MAAKYPEEISTLKPETFDTIEMSITKTFDSLMQELVERRDQLIREICKIREEYFFQNEKGTRKPQEKNVNHDSETNEVMNKECEAPKEQYHPNPTTSPPHFYTSGLGEIRHRIESFGTLGDEVNLVYTSKMSPIRSIGEEGEGRVELDCPHGIVLDGRGNMYIADSENHRIQLVSLAGEFIREFGKRELTYPTTIALFRYWLFVTDVYQNKLLKYNIQSYVLECKSELELSEPSGIAAENYELFVADRYNNRIVVLSLDFKLLRELGHHKLVEPKAVEINDNKVFVVDNSKHHNIYVFSKIGYLLSRIISLRSGTDYTFLCFDKFNNILISDMSCKIIQIYTLEGHLIHTIECDYHPTGIAVTQDNMIISVDFINSKIYFY